MDSGFCQEVFQTFFEDFFDFQIAFVSLAFPSLGTLLV